MLNINNIMLATLLTLSSLASAEDLFDTNLARDYKPTTIIQSDSTIGGYAIFQGGRRWFAISGRTNSNNLNLKLGTVQFVSPIANDYFAEMSVMVNLHQGNSYYTSEACNSSHLFELNKGSGRYDNCLSISPYISNIRGKNITTLHINVRNSQQGARIYDLHLLLNVSQMGFPQTVLADWTEDAISRDIGKKQLFEKVTVWAKKLQEAVNRAIDYSKPLDAFSEVPPINDLLPRDGVFATESESTLGTGIKTTSPLKRIAVVNPVAEKTLVQRLSELKELLDKGLITHDQYENRSSEIIKEF